MLLAEALSFVPAHANFHAVLARYLGDVLEGYKCNCGKCKP
jgi:hypothetical protein